MNKNKAFTKGANAFNRGESRCPLSDPAFHPFTNLNAKNMDIDLFKSWLKGWDTANLKHEESDMAEHIATAKAEAFNEQVLTHGPYRPDPEAEQEEAHERWLEDMEYKSRLKKEQKELVEGVRFNKDGSVTLSANWIMENAEKD